MIIKIIELVELEVPTNKQFEELSQSTQLSIASAQLAHTSPEK